MKTAATATAVGLIAGLTVAAPTSASAHGSIDSPASRAATCPAARPSGTVLAAAPSQAASWDPGKCPSH